jgi:hypothetical protein
MFIIHGQTIKRTPTGRTLTFCPVCRDLSEFTTTEVRAVSHVYYIPMGSGKFLANELLCRNCGVLLAEKTSGLQTLHESQVHDAWLAIEDHPPQWLSSRRDLEHRIDSLSPTERESLILEPLTRLQYFYLARRKAASKVISALILLCIILAMATMLAFTSQADPIYTMVLSAAAGVAACLILTRSAKARRDAARKDALPFIARALLPLHPSHDELATALQAARKKKASLAKALNPDLILSAIEDLP